MTVRPSKLAGEFAVFGTNIVDIADVAVIDLLVVIVFDLHHFVAGARTSNRKRSTLRSPAGFRGRLQFDV